MLVGNSDGTTSWVDAATLPGVTVTTASDSSKLPLTGGALTGTVTNTGPYKGKVYDKGGQVYNVMAYGAVCDGSTDDSTAFASAISAASGAGGGIVQVPAGTCKIASVAMAANVTLRAQVGRRQS